MLAELVALFTYHGLSGAPVASAASPIPAAASGVTNTQALGLILYTKYVYFFQAAGLILLVAMIGAIVLTLKHRVNVKRQSVSDQVARGPKTALEVVKVPSGGLVVPAAAKRPKYWEPAK